MYNADSFEAEVQVFMQEGKDISATSTYWQEQFNNKSLALRWFFNNFRLLFPGGFKRRDVELYEASVKADTSKYPKGMENRDSFRRKLIRDLDAILTTLTFDPEILIRLQQSISGGYSEETLEVLQTVYIQLRNKGYTHSELVR